MKSNFSRFLHITSSYSGIREVFTSSLSLSDLIGESRSNKVANLFHLDYRVKFENDNIGVDHRVKPDNDSLCAGRSMVEMLGVLAIIGVLSVGAVSGYGKAMFKYRLNKQTEQLNQVIGAMVRYKSSLMLNPASADAPVSDYQVVPLLKKLGEIPKEMYTGNDRFIKDAFGTEYYIYHRNTDTGITLCTYNLERNESGFQLCKNLYLIAKEWHHELDMIAVSAYKGDTFSSKGCYLGDNHTYQGCSRTRYIKDLKLSELDDICRTAAGEQGHYSVSIEF